jgi:predicted DCC family thiol-disulfide oxidoreductase YuxK
MHYVLYDDACGACSQWARWLKTTQCVNTPHQPVTWLGASAAQSLRQAYHLSEAETSRSIVLVSVPDDETVPPVIYRKAAAISQLLQLAQGPGHRVLNTLGRLYQVPPLGTLADLGYPLVARLRYTLSALLGLKPDRCTLPQPPAKP